MLHEINGKKIWVACISHARPQNVEKIHKHIICTWYTKTKETDAYVSFGAKSVREIDGNIVVARNAAILEARNQGCDYCLQLSDDVSRFYEFISDKKAISVDFQYVFEKMASYLSPKCVLVGLSIQNNTRNYKKTFFTTNKLVVNDCVLINTKFLYDENANLKEDYDMFLTLVTKGHSVIRIDNLAGAFPHRENKGGANGYRNFFVEQKCNLYIFKKWKSLVRNHKTRVNQIEIDYKKLAKLAA